MMHLQYRRKAAMQR